ncbi:hypothetical protein TgHK011_001554 [Trichoderma gracile]|nr:hypothetical protein TgHK011_001554 [Trichoderma gracile]
MAFHRPASSTTVAVILVSGVSGWRLVETNVLPLLGSCSPCPLLLLHVLDSRSQAFRAAVNSVARMPKIEGRRSLGRVSIDPVEASQVGKTKSASHERWELQSDIVLIRAALRLIPRPMRKPCFILHNGGLRPLAN